MFGLGFPIGSIFGLEEPSQQHMKIPVKNGVLLMGSRSGSVISHLIKSELRLTVSILPEDLKYQ